MDLKAQFRTGRSPDRRTCLHTMIYSDWSADRYFLSDRGLVSPIRIAPAPGPGMCNFSAIKTVARGTVHVFNDHSTIIPDGHDCFIYLQPAPPVHTRTHKHGPSEQRSATTRMAMFIQQISTRCGSRPSTPVTPSPSSAARGIRADDCRRVTPGRTAG